MMPAVVRRTTNWLCALLIAFSSFFGPAALHSQQAATAPSSPAKPAPDNEEFTAAADEVLQEVSEITGLKQLTPLKKTLRSRDEIRSYVIREMSDEKNPKERYAEARSAEAFGLLPKGFDFDNFMVDLLTEQIAGLYDPKAGEFYIADWIPVDDQRMVMAHELTHALQDQHFKIEAWTKAARPNDDAELARESVLEGSAMAAMIDYLLKDSGHKVEDFPSIDPSVFAGDLSKTPKMEQAPPFLKDALIFPYFGGLTFSAAILHAGGWSGLSAVFAKPPLSTQQIMHPALYKSGKVPAVVSLPALEKLLGPDWTKLDENLMGEFGWKEVLKQYLGEEKAKPVAAAWEGDRYVVCEQKQSKKLFLLARLKLKTEEDAGAFFTQYSASLQKKYPEQTNPLRLPRYLAFESPDGGIYLRCMGVECVTVEGANRQVFDGITEAMGWPAAPKGTTASTSESSLLQRRPRRGTQAIVQATF